MNDDSIPTTSVKTVAAGSIGNLVGLSDREVAARIQAGQYNRPVQSATKSVGRIFRDNLLSVFNIVIGCIILLIVAFYVTTRDHRLLLDIVGVFSVAFFNTAIAIVQEVRAKLALDKVNMLLAKEVTVVRSGSLRPIPHREIVLGDVIVLRRGDQAVVDGTVLESNHMEIDESLLTGESVPIEKEIGTSIFSGSYCLSGNGYYEVTGLSNDTYASKLTHIAQQLKKTVSPLQRHVDRIVTLLFLAAIVLCALEVALGVYHHQLGAEFVRRLSAILIGLVPQGLVLMASVTFALGIYRISKVGAIVQAFNAIESFANVQVFCMDKTGTLTQNKMTVRNVSPLTADLSLEAIQRLLGTYARCSSDKNATIRAMEVFEPNPGQRLLHEYPFSSQRKMSVLKLDLNGVECAYALGAFEVLLDRTDTRGRDYALEQVSGAGLENYRNLLFGEVLGSIEVNKRPMDLGGLGIRPLAIVSLSDVVRPDVGQVIEEFRGKGIKFKILSGDSASSVLSTCRDIGWDISASEVMTGADIDRMGLGKLGDVVETRTVFARLKPEHKVQIIQALRARGIHTGMIGDGVNDVPAIKQADLGMAMDEGAAITKEVSDIVLLKNRFTLLPEVFEEGKKIINTVGSIARLFLTKNFMVIYLTLASALLLWEFPLTPRRVSFINIFAIGLPALVIALTNRNTRAQWHFVADMLSFVMLSALIIVASGYVGFFIAKNLADKAGYDVQVPEMVMLSIMIITCVASFIMVGVLAGKRGRAVYLGYGVLLVGLYSLVVATQTSNKLLGLAKHFYEISDVNGQAWRVVATVSLVSSLVLAVAQKLRFALIHRKRS